MIFSGRVLNKIYNSDFLWNSINRFFHALGAVGHKWVASLYTSPQKPRRPGTVARSAQVFGRLELMFNDNGTQPKSIIL